jgi:hypothetical protein
MRLTNLNPVKGYRAERYVLVSLVAFAVTVIALRTILWMTGYPQMGNETVHIAHAVWGGWGCSSMRWASLSPVTMTTSAR